MYKFNTYLQNVNAHENFLFIFVMWNSQLNLFIVDDI